MDNRDFDTIVCAASEIAFIRAYIDNNAWWAIHLSQKAIENIKHIALYEKSPKAHIAHVAEIDYIKPYKDTGKFILYLKNKRIIKAIPLDKDKRGSAPQSPRYTTIKKIKEAKKISDLWN